jgi:hypothetical protein
MDSGRDGLCIYAAKRRIQPVYENLEGYEVYRLPKYRLNERGGTAKPMVCFRRNGTKAVQVGHRFNKAP